MMDWNTLISAKRFGLEEFHKERHENRSGFRRDYGRLIFSTALSGDCRTRHKCSTCPAAYSLPVAGHSLEVSCVGRSLGNDIAKAILARRPEHGPSYLRNQSRIGTAACLAHGWSNPPFGHSDTNAPSLLFSEGLAMKNNPTENNSLAQWEDLTVCPETQMLSSAYHISLKDAAKAVSS